MIQQNPKEVGLTPSKATSGSAVLVGTDPIELVGANLNRLAAVFHNNIGTVYLGVGYEDVSDSKFTYRLTKNATLELDPRLSQHKVWAVRLAGYTSIQITTFEKE